MLKAIITFLAVASTVFFVNDKFSKAVRVIAFSESESKNSAIYSFFMIHEVYYCLFYYFLNLHLAEVTIQRIIFLSRLRRELEIVACGEKSFKSTQIFQISSSFCKICTDLSDFCPTGHSFILFTE